MPLFFKVQLVVFLFWLSCRSVDGLLSTAGTLREKVVPELRGLENNFIIVPEHNLLFCWIQKVGCATFNELFRRLRSRYDPSQTEGSRWGKNTLRHHNITTENLASMLVNKTWHKAVFYREPVERFASAFASKCENADRDGPMHCRLQFGKERLEFGDAIQWMADFDAKGSGDESSFDVHWRRQSSFCGGLDKTLQHYDTVEELTIDTSNAKVAKLLNTIGVDPQSIEGFDDLFPPAGGKQAFVDSGDRYSRRHTTNTESSLQHYFPQGVARQRLDVLATHYRPDYELFGVELPHAERSLRAGDPFWQARWPLLEFSQ